MTDRKNFWLIVRVAVVATLFTIVLTHGPRTTVVHRPPNQGAARLEAADPGATPVKLGAGRHVALTGASGCGVERWSIKTLTDPGANQVNLKAVPETIAGLDSIAAPVEPTDRVAPIETTTYTVSGTLIFTAKEADGDYHLAIEDSAGRTMIAEIPNPSCAAGSVALNQITEARKEFEVKFGVPGQYPAPALKPNVPITLTGVGFFDKLHGQTGVAPNGIELHPVLSLQTTAGLATATAPVPKLKLIIGETHGAD